MAVVPGKDKGIMIGTEEVKKEAFPRHAIQASLLPSGWSIKCLLQLKEVRSSSTECPNQEVICSRGQFRQDKEVDRR